MRQTIFILTIIAFGLKVQAQDISIKYPALMKIVNDINANKTFSKVVLENDEFMSHGTDGGGELIGYFANGQIQKITVSVGISIGIRTFDYYFHKDNLVFVYEKLDGYLYDDSLGVFDNTKTETNFAGRYYFKNNKLIDSMTLGHNRFENDELDIQTVLLDEMKGYLALLKKKGK